MMWWFGLPWPVWVLAAVAAFALGFLAFAAWQLTLSERKLAEAGERWERNGRVVMADDGIGRRVVVGETCGAPTERLADWIVARHDYELLPWYRRLITREPRLPHDA